MGRVQGKVALITGAGGGQGQSHAVRLAEEGADIIAVDIGKDIGSVTYSMATTDQLVQTAKLVEEHGRRVLTRQADVRDQGALDAVVADALTEFGRIDIVSANAGITSVGKAWELTEGQWQDVIDVNLTGTWHTVKAALPSMIERGHGGCIVLTASLAAQKGFPNCGHYVAAKHGVAGLMKTLAAEVGQYSIRVNAILPTTVSNTAMFDNPGTLQMLRPDQENPTVEDAGTIIGLRHVLPVPYIEPIDVSNALVFLVSDEAHYITGVALPVDAGSFIK